MLFQWNCWIYLQSVIVYVTSLCVWLCLWKLMLWREVVSILTAISERRHTLDISRNSVFYLMQTNRFNRQKDHCWEKQSKSKGFSEVCVILNCLPYSKIGILLILQQLKVRILLPWECVGWIFMRDTSVSFFSHRTSSSSSVCSFVSWYFMRDTSVSFFLASNFVIVLVLFIHRGWYLLNACMNFVKGFLVCFQQYTSNYVDWWL